MESEDWGKAKLGRPRMCRTRVWTWAAAHSAYLGGKMTGEASYLSWYSRPQSQVHIGDTADLIHQWLAVLNTNTEALAFCWEEGSLRQGLTM